MSDNRKKEYLISTEEAPGIKGDRKERMEKFISLAGKIHFDNHAIEQLRLESMLPCIFSDNAETGDKP